MSEKIVSKPSHRGLVNPSTRSPALKTGPLPFVMLSTYLKKMNASSAKVYWWSQVIMHIQPVHSTAVMATAVDTENGEPESRSDEQLLMVTGDWVRAGSAGLFYADKQLGMRINKGETIGRVSNLFGHVTEEVKSPVDGIVFGLRHSAVANVGDYIANIGQIKM